jgi:hypothetical protein
MSSYDTWKTTPPDDERPQCDCCDAPADGQWRGIVPMCADHLGEARRRDAWDEAHSETSEEEGE